MQTEDIMPLSWKKVARDDHERLPPKKRPNPQDPVWTEIMQELEQGNAVQLACPTEKERGGLARAAGRRAAGLGFKLDIRYGDGVVSLRRLSEAEVQATPPVKRASRRASSWLADPRASAPQPVKQPGSLAALDDLLRQDEEELPGTGSDR
jgi:hypothetical protein